MVNILPAVTYVAPTIAPPRGGLYTAATVIDQPGPARIVGGMTLIPSNCGVSGIEAVDCEPGDFEFRGDGPGLGETFPPFMVWAADECSLDRTDDEARTRAQHILSLTERVNVERAVADVLVDRAGVLGTSTGNLLQDRIRDAVATFEGMLGARGLTGIIHAPARLAAYAKAAGVVDASGGTMTTPLGHRWAFGGGYDELGEALFVTGPAVVLRSEVVTTRGLAVRKNERLMVSQREVTFAWECLLAGINVGSAA